MHSLGPAVPRALYEGEFTACRNEDQAKTHQASRQKIRARVKHVAFFNALRFGIPADVKRKG